jgi:hypothetical protein
MGRRSRKRAAGEPAIEAPEETYAGPDGAELVLRCVLTPKTRAQYARVSDPSAARAAAGTEDVWHRSVEFLFERLAVRWTVNGVPTEGQRDLLQRFRVATQAERAWVRETLRTHCRDWFPDVQAP